MLPAAAPAVVVFTLPFSADVAHMVTGVPLLLLLLLLLPMSGAGEVGAAALVLAAGAADWVAGADPPVFWLAEVHAASRAAAPTRPATAVRCVTADALISACPLSWAGRGSPGRGASLSGRPFVTAGGAPGAGGRSPRR